MPNYSNMLSALRSDRERFIAEWEALGKKIDSITSAIESLELLAVQESDAPILAPPPMAPDEEKGFTDRVREILKANEFRALIAVDIRDVLLKSDPNADPKVALIHAHNTLKRLERQKEVVEVIRGDGRTAYRWTPASEIDYSTAASHLGNSERKFAHASGRRTVSPPPGSDPIEDALKAPMRKK